MRKRTISLVLAFILILGTASTALAVDFDDHWAKDEINYVIEKDIAKGYEDGTFKPNNDITRAEFVTMMNRAFDIQEAEDTDSEEVDSEDLFTDVVAEDWFFNEVAKAVETGYIKGYEDGTFKPGNKITREEAATVIARIQDLEEEEEAAIEFTDADSIQDYAKGYVNAATKAGYISGYDTGDFKPQGAITRAETAKILYNILTGEEEEPIEPTADKIIYINGNIYTVDEDFSNAEAFVIEDGKFAYVGDTETAKGYADEDTEIIDLEGKTVIPGLIDSHLHYGGVGSLMQMIDAFWLEKDKILDLVADAAEEAEPDEWIIGRGWNQAVWDPAVFPTKLELDEVAPDNPVVLTRVCGHAIWTNSKAMEVADIDADGEITENPVGGEIIRKSEEDEAEGLYPDLELGEAIGVFTDTASYEITKHRPEYTEKQLVEQLELAQDHILSYGVTSVRDAGSSLATFNRLKDLYDKDELKIRIYMMSSSGDAPKFYEMPEEERVGLYGDRLTVRSVKLMTDGSLGARSSWMLEPYSDREGHVGDQRYTDEEFYELVKPAGEAGFQVNTHAIGDAANRQVLDVYEKVINELGLEDHRFSVEHAQIVDLDDIPRFAELGVIPSMQFVHATSDLNMAEDRVGPERILGAYAWRKMLDNGSIIANGTDAQVERVNPYEGLYAGVTRMNRDGEPEGGWYPEEKLTREEALRAYTIWGAYAQFMEDKIGSIEEGKYADFVIIDRDYMEIPEAEIKDIKALTTVIAGEVVYEAPEN